MLFIRADQSIQFHRESSFSLDEQIETPVKIGKRQDSNSFYLFIANPLLKNQLASQRLTFYQEQEKLPRDALVRSPPIRVLCFTLS